MPPPPPQRPASSRAGRANLFSSPPPSLPKPRNLQNRSVPLPPLPRRRRHPRNHDELPSQEQQLTDPAPRTNTTNPAFRTAHLRTAYRKPVPPVAASGEGEALLAADPTDAAAGRAVVVGPSGLSFRLPGAPFDFQFSYSEAPRAPPLAIREPAFLPFAPPTMPRPWTGKAPLLTKEEKARRRGVRLHTPLGQEPPQTVSAHGIMMEVRGRRQLDLARVSPGDGRSREEVLGEPLTPAEVRALVKPHISHNRQLNIGRDGLTHNMLEMIHCHWRRQEICKVRCRGVPTVDMNNLCYHLEEKSGGKVIHRVGGVIFLYRGRHYDPRTRPRYPLMLWKPATPVFPKLIKEVPEGLTKEEADEMRRKGHDLLPICKLAKNGIYISLVKDVRDAFEGNDLVKIDCEGLNPSDYKKIGAKLRDLVPCVLLSFDNEQILMYRGKEWKSRYSKPLTLIPKNNLAMPSDVSTSDTDEATDANNQVAIREVLRPKMFKLWKSALESSLALLLDDAEVNDLTPDSLLTRVEEFSVTSQAVEHSFPALLVGNGEGNPEVLSAEHIEDESDTGGPGYQEGPFEQSPDHSDDEHFEFDMFERMESSAPLGSLPIDTMIERMNSE
ncbi:CRS2-associated factor 2, chloroplastic-like [Phragmites australis]|uniref:CRS2-associated factor 2, chloroplastic-like n=1 Tax=Phragmites australis TaxID=29695 RepID=UPI002D794D7A|nr:CRS2-associated factor 2, chloroplastic-like [Phragmites australis]